MSQLLLVCELEDGVSIDELLKCLKAACLIQNVWMDPCNEPRAVVRCDKKRDLGDVKIKSSSDSTVEISRYLETAKPTTSVFVKTYKSITFGITDKLKYLFTSQKHGGRKVQKVEQLRTEDDDCYELFFLKWDDVLHICKGTWIVEKQRLTVVPFFDSFREPFKQQLKRLIEINRAAIQAKRGDASFVPHKESVTKPSLMLKPSEIPFKMSPNDANASVETFHHAAKNQSENKDLQRTFSSSSSMSSVSDFTTGEEDRKAVSHTGKKGDMKSAKPVLEHPYILTLLHLLKFENAVHQKYNMVKLTIYESNWEVEITGPVASLKIIQKLLTEEDELDHPTLTETFVGNEGTLQDLKTFIDSAGLYVNIVDAQGKPFLQVTNSEERKETFHDFIFTLVVSKECSPLPSRECQKQTEWMEFVKSFEDSYTYQQIFVEDTSVTLVCLASRSQGIDNFVNIINKTICQLKGELKPMPNSDHISQSSKSPDEGIQSFGDAGSVGRKESSEFTKTICIGNSVLLWILNVLNLKDSLRQITDDLDVDIDENEEEIFISGSKELFQKLKAVLVKEDKKFQLTENEQAFLCDPVLRESLKSSLISQGCCILLNDSLEIFVASKDGHQAHFRDFLASFIQFKTVTPLSEKYWRSEQWITLLEHFKNNYPHHHILTAEGQVYLLSIAADEKYTQTLSVLKELESAITALTSPVFSGKQLSLTKAVGDQKCEEKKMDSTRISAADKSSVKKVTLCYKHSVLLWILNRLQLKAAAHKFAVSVTITSDEIIIEGPKKTVKSLESVLMQEDNEMPFEDEETFLADVQILQKLDLFLKESRAHLVLDEKTLELFVITESREKVKFRNFLTSFIHFKRVSHLPEKYQQTREWNSLVEHCNNNYPHHHILTADDQVYLLSIAPGENNAEADSLLKKLTAVVTALTSPVLPVNEEIDGHKWEGMEIDSSQVSATDKVSRKKVTLLYKHSVLLRILNSLQLKEAAHKFGVSVTMSADEIIIEGPRNMVRTLETVLMQEDNEMPFEDEETFFTDEQIQQNLDSCLKDSGAHLVLDEKTLELFVIINSGPKAKFRDFLTSFIQFKTVTPLSEKYWRSEQWTTLLEHCKKNYPHHHILTSDDQVYLLSIAADETNTQTVSILKKLAIAVTTLTSPVLPGNDLFSDEEIQDQTVEELKIDSSKVSAADLGSKKKVTLCYKHPVLFQILNNLRLKEAARKYGVCVTMSTEDKIIIEGPKKAVKCLESVLIKEDNEMHFEDQEEFFTNEEVHQHLDSCLKDSRAHIILDDNLELFVITKPGEEEQFRTFITRFIRFQKCADLPEKYQNDPAWKTKLQQFGKQNFPHLILTNAEEVYLLTISSIDKSHEADLIMERINKAISDSTLSHDSDMDGDDENHSVTFDCPKMKIRYLQHFMTNDIQSIHEMWKNVRLKIELGADNLQISSSSSDITNQIVFQFQESLSRINRVIKAFSFPGLPTFLNSVGTSLIHSLSDEYRCLIEVQNTDTSNPQRLSLDEDEFSENSQGLEYKVKFLGSANCGGFNIHLVQGDIVDLNLEMKIQLQPSEEVERCEVRSHRSSLNVIIYLPPWSAPNEGSCHSHMEKLRNSFHEASSVAFEQVKFLKRNAVAFSTAPLTKSGYSFPASVIAKEIIEILYEKSSLNLAASRTDNKTFDVYICDPGNEAVFSAFNFFLKHRQAYLVSPSQVAWDKVSFPDSYKYPDYNTFKSRGIQIEVLSRTPYSWGNNHFVFYPIHPSLESSSCPAILEQKSAERSIKSSITDLQGQNQDGLVTGEIFPLKGFFDSRHAFVYCSPDWGVDCDQDIDRILENCLRKSGPGDVYIIPPGMQLMSKYPVGYLAQTLFRKLDNILQHKEHLLHKRKCVLLVQDVVYRKAFERELQKRYPKIEETGIIQSIKNWWNSSEKEKTIKDEPRTIVRKSHVQSTDIVFWGTHGHIQKTVMDLERHLSGLLKVNTVTRSLNKEQTRQFQTLMQNIENRHVQVSVSLTECYEMKKQKKKRRKHREETNRDSLKMTGSLLKIEGLQKSYLEKFLSDTGLGDFKEEHVNTLKKEESQGKTNVPLKNIENVTEEATCLPLQASVKSAENANSVERNDRQQKNESKLSKQENVSCSKLLQGSYKWLCESDRHDSFEMITLKTETDIEDAYIKGKDQQKLTGNITHVDFISMTAMKNNVEMGIIRTEAFGPGNKSSSHKNPKLVKMEDNTDEYKYIISELDECITKYKLFIVEVSKVAKNNLHTRFEQKYAHLKDKNCSWMWHRPLSNYKQQVCRYGFHPRFSGMPDAKHLGEGVLFYKKPGMFFGPEMKTEEEIHLVYCKVYHGRSCPGAPRLRCLQQDEKTGECFDSVSEGEACMIFSDAQAYPEFVITLKFIENSGGSFTNDE